MLVFACFSPHPPIILPTVGSPADREKVKSTISALESLAPKLAAAKPEIIIISSPHPDWGVNVPLHFLLPKNGNPKHEIRNPKSPQMRDPAEAGQFSKFKFQKFKNFEFRKLEFVSGFGFRISDFSIYSILTTLDSPRQHFEWGKQIASIISEKLRWAWIASGDMSHVLKEDGPYGFHPSGPKFDREFIERLKKKDVQGIFNMDPQLIEEAGVCGLWSFCMLLGALEGSHTRWQPEILSYEGPFGVGYLVVKIKLKNSEAKYG